MADKNQTREQRRLRIRKQELRVLDSPDLGAVVGGRCMGRDFSRFCSGTGEGKNTVSPH